MSASLPGRDEAGHAAPVGVHDVKCLAVDHAQRNPADFTIVATLITLGDHRPFEDQGRLAQIDMSLDKNRLPLVLVPLKFQSRPIYTKVYTFSSNRPESPENIGAV
jgi:hypothetical protein